MTQKKKKQAKHSVAVHKWAAIQWALHVPAVIFIYYVFPDLWEKISILYLALVSIYANFVGHWGAYQASRSEESSE